jgi:opacity protein-like surface antigen
MKQTMKFVLGLSLAVALLATSAFAVTNTPVVVKTTTVSPATSLYNAGEFGLSIGSGYSLGKAESLSGKTLFQSAYDFNLNAGVFYFPWRNLGVEVNLPFYQTKGVSVDVQAGLLLRLPLSKSTPVLKSLSPYIGLGGVASWGDNQEKWAYLAKVGLEFRANSKWSLFTEGQYRNVDFKWGQGQTSLVGGLRLVL